jgi:hypothetical protein
LVTVEQFSDALARYLESLRDSGSEASIRHRCLDFLRQSLGISLEAGDELEQRVFQGRVDAVLGRLVIEFKRDLTASLPEAEAQLRRYLTDLHRQHPAATYTGVACDGRRFRVYRPTYDDGGEASLEATGELDLSLSLADPQDAYFWLDGLFAHFRRERAVPTARSIGVALGPNSPTFRHASRELLALFRQVEGTSEVAVRYREWQSYLSIVYGSAVGDDALFVRHTYLSLVARFIARFFLDVGSPRQTGAVPLLASPEDLVKTVNGEYFREQAIHNFIEDDFFTWLLAPEIIESGVDLVRRLASSLAAYDFAQARQDLLKGLYQELVDPETRHDLGEYYTPDWLAEYMLAEELGLSRDPDRSVLDPSCGSGTFLFTAIRLIVEARLARGEDRFDVLLHVLNQVMGMDAHPVAVTIARVNYLLALGELVQGPRPPVLLPVYLSNAIILPGSTAETEPLGGYLEPVHTVTTGEPGVVFELPQSVATNPQMLDWLFDRFTNYLAGAKLRLRAQAPEEAVQAVLNAFHNYLVSPKPRTPIPEPLSPFAAEVMGRTARTLLNLYLEGKDHVWLFILKNLPASIYLAQRQFDLVVGNPPWLSLRYIRNPQYRQRVRALVLQDYQLLSRRDTHLFTQMELATLFFARCADLYLKGPEARPVPPPNQGASSISPPYQGGDTGGVIAMVMPRAVLTADQHRRFTGFSFKGGTLALRLERVLDLEGVSPLFNVPACVLVARMGQPTALRQAQGERGTIYVRGEPVEPQVAQGAIYPVPGTVFQGDVPSRNASWAEAQPRLERIDTTFDRQGGQLLPQGVDYSKTE